MARKPKNVEPESAAAGGSRSAKGFKGFLIALVVVDLIAAGGLAFLTMIKRADLDRELKRNEANLLRLKVMSENVALQTNRIRQENLQKVSVPSELISAVANRMKTDTGETLGQNIKIGTPVTRRWNRGSYNEITTDVQFLQKTGYEFRGLIRFLQEIERANPKVQIKAINFGKRTQDDETARKDFWHVINMTVRVFSPREGT